MKGKNWDRAFQELNRLCQEIIDSFESADRLVVRIQLYEGDEEAAPPIAKTFTRSPSQ